MVVGGSRQETLDSGFVLLGTRQQGVPVILRELVLIGGFDLVSPSFTVRDVTTGSSGHRSTSCRTEMRTPVPSRLQKSSKNNTDLNKTPKYIIIVR
ncbi:unnamed protein product [Schistosoma margrebowiei]|uniref:Uncharacterized protein n=1 Tax=Schistosoma margrebowiei TaxID=48269 RepID=A0A183MIR4_9TREM|nr:unnamed protein product [Schistosoma margrebowiei]